MMNDNILKAIFNEWMLRIMNGWKDERMKGWQDLLKW